ncbi:MAG: ThiF family adenylyltransferase [Rhizobiales bacterium]|nr:ThiF family adenylyltransferase [Hyphomicrobiales bacterium]
MNIDIRSIPHIEFTRFGGSTIDVEVMQAASVVLVGTGGGRLVAELLARSALGNIVIIDPDTVDGTRNPLTQGHAWSEHGEPKAQTTARACWSINHTIEVKALEMTWEEACASEEKIIASANFLAACTDSYAVNRAVRRFGLAHGIDVVEGWIYPDGDACEHVTTFPEVAAAGCGCGTCHLWMRHRAYEQGFQNPRDIPAYAIPSAYSSVQTAQIIIARLHQRAGSTLPIVRLAEQFQHRPAQITRLNPNFWAAPGEPFGDTPDEFGTFMTRAYGKDWPADWECPDCQGGRHVKIGGAPKF